IGVEGIPFPMPLLGLPLSVSIVGDAGKIDVLNASPALLLRYLDSIELDADQRELMVEAITEARRVKDAAAIMEALSVALTSHGAGLQLVEDFTMRSGLTGIDPR